MKKSLAVLGVVCVMATASMAETLNVYYMLGTAFNWKLSPGDPVNNCYKNGTTVTVYIDAVISDAPAPTGFGLCDMSLIFTLSTPDKDIASIVNGGIYQDPILHFVDMTKAGPEYVDSNSDGEMDQAIDAALGATNFNDLGMDADFNDYQTDPAAISSRPSPR